MPSNGEITQGHVPAFSYAQLRDAFPQCRVLVVGDVMLDRFIYGHADRISPEAPIPVFTVQQEKNMLGGAGNVARGVVALGGRVSFIGVIGKDKSGHEISALLGQEPLITPYLMIEPDRASTTKVRYVAENQQLLRADQETKHPIIAATLAQLLATASSELPQHDVMILSDYGKGMLPPGAVSALIALGERLGKPVLVDPKSRDFSLYRGATCVSPNLHELANAAGAELSSQEAIIAAAYRLMAEHGLHSLLVTCGKDGMMLVTPEGPATHIPSEAREVYDVSGAGDTVIATLALGLGSGLKLHDAAYLANMAAGIVVGRAGTAVVTLQDMEAALFMEHRTGGLAKLVPASVAAQEVAVWKRAGKRVGFTNGCFDLMHSGHIALLTLAKARCDRLIVAVNSDASVKRLKGEQRPVNGELERALILASLTVVDRVIVFSEDTPLLLLELLHPDVLIKGADYQKHQVVGYELVESYGGEIALIPLKEGYSTTNIIKKIA